MPKSKKTGALRVVTVGDSLLIRHKGKTRGRRHKRARKVVKLPMPRHGCVVVAIVYDHESHRTTFVYDCSGGQSYSVTRSGNFF